MWEAVIGVGTVLLALATFALAISAYRQTQASQRATTAALAQAEASQAAVAAALKSVDQAWRTRIDERSPYVVAYTDEVQWPPRLQSQAFGEDSPFDVPGNRKFVITEQPARPLFLDLTGRLVNEGRASAFVRLPPGMTRVGHAHGAVSDERGRILLRPGAELKFSFRLQKTLKEWADQYEAHAESELNEHGHRHGIQFGEIIISTGYDEGVVDYVFMQAWALPIQPVHNDPGRWVRATGDRPLASLGLSPTRRRYYYSKIDNVPASGPPRAPWHEQD